MIFSTFVSNELSRICAISRMPIPHRNAAWANEANPEIQQAAFPKDRQWVHEGPF
jgi:hypothetical protein